MALNLCQGEGEECSRPKVWLVLFKCQAPRKTLNIISADGVSIGTLFPRALSGYAAGLREQPTPKATWKTRMSSYGAHLQRFIEGVETTLEKVADGLLELWPLWFLLVLWLGLVMTIYVATNSPLRRAPEQPCQPTEAKP